MSRKILLTAVALALVPAMLIGLHYCGKSTPQAAQAQEDPPGKDRPPVTSAGDPSPKADPPTAGKPEKPKPAATTADKPKPGAAEQLRSGKDVILAVLEEPTSLKFTETPLGDVVEFLQRKHAVHIRIDQRALDDVGVGADVPITFSISNVSLRSALELMLRDIDLTWTLVSDVLLITTPEEAESHLVTKTYDVSDLLVSAPDYSYGGGLPTTSPLSPRTSPQPWAGAGGTGQPSGGSGAGMGGMGGMGMGAGMGMFSVKDDIGVPSVGNVDAPGPACQLPSPSIALSPSRSLPPSGNEMDDLIAMIVSVIAPTTWEDFGGPGNCEPFGKLLVVSQTFDVHTQIEALLEMIRAEKRAVPTVVIDARWLLLDSDLLDQLLRNRQAEQAAGSRIAVDPETLDRLTREVPGCRGLIACSSGQKVHLAAGDRRTVVTSAIPVVGSGVGYQPVVAIPNVGVVLEIRPSILPGKETALLDVQSIVTRWRKPDPPVQIGGQFPPSQVEEGTGETVEQPGGTASVSVDRVNLPTLQLAATMRVPLGKPVLLGGLTLSPTEEAAVEDAPKERRQLYLVVQTNVAAK